MFIWQNLENAERQKEKNKNHLSTHHTKLNLSIKPPYRDNHCLQINITLYLLSGSRTLTVEVDRFICRKFTWILNPNGSHKYPSHYSAKMWEYCESNVHSRAYHLDMHLKRRLKELTSKALFKSKIQFQRNKIHPWMSLFCAYHSVVLCVEHQR